jgi:hypothetical protein
VEGRLLQILRLLVSSQGKRFLLAANDMKPNSPAMARLLVDDFNAKISAIAGKLSGEALKKDQR